MARTPRSFQVEAVVLKHSEYGEADRILTLYTRERGKVRAIAKGVRKLRSRKAGHLEPFTLVKVQLATGRNLYIVSQAEAIDSHGVLRDDLVKLGYAAYVVEVLDKFTLEEEENTAVYHNLRDTLHRLQDHHDLALVVRYYELRLLDALGFRPELHYCVVSGNEIEAEDQYFSAPLGGVVSPQPGRELSGAVPVSLEALRYLRHLQRSDWHAAQRAKITQGTKNELEVLMHHYLTFQLEKALNTPAFLRRVRAPKDHTL